MSALDKIRQAFPELANASDSEVLGEAALRTGSSVAQLSDTLGIAPRSTLGEGVRQFGAGLTVDAPRMAGQALKYFSDAGGERVGEGAFPVSEGPQALSANMAYRFLKLHPDTVLAKHLLNLLTCAVAAQKPTCAVVVCLVRHLLLVRVA